MQEAAPRQIGNGRSILSNSSAPFSRCGTPPTWTRPAATWKCCLPSST
jgi:hypothetical protein